MLTSDFVRVNGWVKTVNGQPAPDHLLKLRIPPAWTEVQVEPNLAVPVVAVGVDAAGRKQRLYSPSHIANAKSTKFERVRALLAEWEDLRTQIEADLNNRHLSPKDREAALVTYLIYETGIRPGSNNDTLAQVQAYGATTLQLRHITWSARGVRLRFVGKKGVRQNVLVTNPYLVRELRKRKRATTAWSTVVFDVSASKLREYFGGLGSGIYSPKDFRTARGTSLALELLSWRKRLPRSRAGRKRIVNAALDQVAKQLGNTRAVSRSCYVDPAILERFLPPVVN